MYGKLSVFCGPMYASKSTSLLKHILWSRHGENKTVLVLKPAYDIRYHTTKIVSHDGLSSDAVAISSWSEVSNLVNDAEVICFDEIQFFAMPHFDDDIAPIIRNLLDNGKDVIAAGLDMDSDGFPFHTTAIIMAMADEVSKQKAYCTICGQQAGKTLKKKQNNIKDELGSKDLYEARCNLHWRE